MQLYTRFHIAKIHFVFCLNVPEERHRGRHRGGSAARARHSPEDSVLVPAARVRFQPGPLAAHHFLPVCPVFPVCLHCAYLIKQKCPPKTVFTKIRKRNVTDWTSFCGTLPAISLVRLCRSGGTLKNEEGIWPFSVTAMSEIILYVHQVKPIWNFHKSLISQFNRIQ